MAGKSNISATNFAQKKLLGRANTSNLKVDGEELIGSNVQIGNQLVFGEPIPSSPSRTEYLLQSASNGGPATIEYITFTLSVITGTTYDADDTGGGGGSDSGEGSQSSGPHAYKFILPSDYETSSSNPKAGNGTFDNGRLVHETLGGIQFIQPFYSQVAPNPYNVKIYKDDGGEVGDEIPLLDNIDWNVDYYCGVLFLQDYDASKIPAFARCFQYVGDFADKGKFYSGLSGSLTQLTDGSSYLEAGENITITSASNGAITITSTGGGGSGDITGVTAGTGLTGGGSSGDVTLDIDDSVVSTLTGSKFTGPVLFNHSIYITGSVSDFTATGSVKFNSGLSGSLTRLIDGSSFIEGGDNITVTSSSNGAITITGVAGDITGITAGTGLTGGGSSGDVTLAIDDSVVATISGSNFKGNVGVTGSLQVTTGNAIITSDQVLILSGGAAASADESDATDMAFFVSGAIGSKGTSTKGVSLFGGDVASSGTFYSLGEIYLGDGDSGAGMLRHNANTDLYVRFVSNDTMQLVAGGNEMITLREASYDVLDINYEKADIDFRIYGQDADNPAFMYDAGKDQILILSGGLASDPSEAEYNDVAFFVSGAIGSKNTSTRGTSLFGGDVVSSGSFSGINGLTGSLTRLIDGSSYLIAGNNVTITSSSNGAIVIKANKAPGASGRTKVAYEITSELPAESNFNASSNSFSESDYDPDLIDIFLNGQLLMSGTSGEISSGEADYTLTGNTTLQFGFVIEVEDILNVATFATGSTTSTSTYTMVFNETPSGNVNGSNKDFTIASETDPSGSIMLFLNGQNMTLDLDYGISSTTITFSDDQVPQTGDIVRTTYQKET